MKTITTYIIILCIFSSCNSKDSVSAPNDYGYPLTITDIPKKYNGGSFGIYLGSTIDENGINHRIRITSSIERIRNSKTTVKVYYTYHQNKMSHYEKFTIGSIIDNGDIGEGRSWDEIEFKNGVGKISWNDGRQIFPARSSPYNKPLPYDPEKAGAYIVKNFDITDVIPFFEAKNHSEHGREFKNYDMAEYNGSIYIRFGQALYVFDKDTMRKTGEIAIIMPPEFNYLPTEDYIPSPKNGLVIIGKRAFVLLVDNISTPYIGIPYLFSVDLNSGNAELVDEQTLGFSFDNSYPNIMGYSKADNTIWFRINYREKKRVFLYSLIYDNESNTFTMTGTSDWDCIKSDSFEIKKNGHYLNIQTSSFSGNEVWSVYHSYRDMDGVRYTTIIDRRYMNNLTESVSQIYVNRLGTLSVPQSIIYDEPYIWIIVEKDDKIQMLKLLPNDSQLAS